MCPLVPCFKLFGSADLHVVGVAGNGPDAVKRSGDAGRQDCWHVGTPGDGTAYVPSGDLDSRRDKSDLMTKFYPAVRMGIDYSNAPNPGSAMGRLTLAKATRLRYLNMGSTMRTTSKLR